MLTSPRLSLVAALSLLLLSETGCRKRREVTPPSPPSAESAPATESASTPAAIAPVPASVSAPALPTFETSSEFDDLNKDFELYCARKGRVPTDVNEFFREQRIRPPAVPAGKRLAIDRENKRIVLTK